MLGVLAGRVTAVAALVAGIAAICTAPASAASRPAHPAKGTLRLSLPDAFVVGGHLVTVPGRVVHVNGVVRPYVPGQTVLIKAFLGAKQFKTEHLPVKPGGGGQYGTFTEALSSPGAGQVTFSFGQ